MDRREFFRRGLRQASQAAVKGAEGYAARRARHWIRPPYALDELAFLLACTRCGACIEACASGVIFGLAPRLGAQVAGTPALDLLNTGCRLCPDWPCVTACEPGALRRPESGVTEEADAAASPALPRLAQAAIDPGTCLPYRGPECGACRSSCPVPGALVWHLDRPTIDPQRCVGCALCRQACIVEPKAVGIRSLQPALDDHAAGVA